MGLAVPNPMLSVVSMLNLPYVSSGSMVLVAKQAALTIVHHCLRAHVLILGIEGFHFNGATVTPQMDLIADYSRLADLPREQAVTLSVDSAREFIHAAPDAAGLFFEFTID